MSGPVDLHAGVIARMTVPGHRMFHLHNDHPPAALVYPYWILRFPDEVVLVDTGFSPAKAEARGFEMLCDPEAPMRSLGLSYDDVDTVLVSHLHFDHFCDPWRFPRARFVVQRSDVEYFGGRGRQHPVSSIADSDSVADLERLRVADRLVELDGDAIIRDGVAVHHVGGHTPGSQVTVVERDEDRIVLACDASHFYENLETRTPTAILHDYDAYQRGFDTIRALTGADGTWFPGHDPALLDALVPVGDGLHRMGTSSRR